MYIRFLERYKIPGLGMNISGSKASLLLHMCLNKIIDIANIIVYIDVQNYICLEVSRYEDGHIY
jgi:hypothetical protein